MKNWIKNEKGSMTVYAIVTVMTFVIVLMGLFFTTSAIRKNQLKTIPKIKEVYEKELEHKQEIYEARKQKEDYVKQGMILHYDGINNTGNGHSSTATTWKDLSGNHNDGTLIGFDTNSGWQESSIKFDGINDYIISKTNLGLNGNAGLTMVAVASWEGDSWSLEWPSYMGINSTSNYKGLSMTMKEGKPAIDFWNYRYRADNALNVKQTYQICLVKEPGNINTTSKIYIDGKEVIGTGNSVQSPDIMDAQAVVGRLDSTRWANAKIYNVKFYNRTLTQEEIQQNYKIDKSRYQF